MKNYKKIEEARAMCAAMNSHDGYMPPDLTKNRLVHTYTWKEGDATVIFRGTVKQYIRYQKFLELK